MSTKVLMFGWEFPPHNSGGLGTACYGLSRALSARNVDITFVLPKRLENLGVDFLKISFADIQKIKFAEVASSLYPYITSENYQSDRARDGTSLIYGRSLMEEVHAYGARASALARQQPFDIIHAHDWLSFPAGLAAKEISGKPLIVHVHATEFDRTGGGHGINQDVYEIERAGLVRADGIIAVSERTKSMLVEHYGVDPIKVRVVHNGIDELVDQSAKTLDAFVTAGFKVVLFVGRITLQKGPDYFVRLAKRVLDERPKTFFIMAGSGDMEHQIIRQAAALGIADRLLFTGFLRGAELEAVYRAADLYVLPSISEPFGLTVLEAMLRGTPVLVSKQSGVAEVINHSLQADFWDIEELANQTIAVLDHPALARTLAASGREEARHINWISAAEKCVNYYQDFVGQ